MDPFKLGRVARSGVARSGMARARFAPTLEDVFRLLDETQRRLDRHDQELARLRPTRQTGAERVNDKRRAQLRAFGESINKILNKMAEPDLNIAFRTYLRKRHGADRWDNQFSKERRTNALRSIRARYGRYQKLPDAPA